MLLVASAAVAQATSYARAPLLPSVATDQRAELAAVAASTSCGDLLARYLLDHNVWRGGVKDGHKQQVADNLERMVAILERKGALEQAGRCGG